MNINSAIRILASTALLAVFTTACSAMSSMRDADVRLKDGQICFAPGKEKSSTEPVLINALYVSGPKGAKRTGFKPTLAWAFWVKPGQGAITVEPDSCLAYGALPMSSEQTVAPQPLQPNAVYSVFLNGRPSGADSSVLGYKAEFCVLANAAGGLDQVLVVPWDNKAGKWRYDVCN